MTYQIYSIYQLLIILIGLILSIGCLGLLIFKINRKKYLNPKELTITLFLLTISILLNLNNEEILYRNSRAYFIDPAVAMGIVSIIQVLLPVFTCSYILYKIISSKNNLNFNPEEKVEDFIEKVLTSEDFATAFSTRLPVGKDDKKLGLDYIPFILLSLEKRRKRFKLYSDRFLTATLVLGISFIAIVIYFGYILLNDSSAGISKNISDLKTEIRQANANFQIIKAVDLLDAFNKETEFQKIERVQLKKNDLNYKNLESLKKSYISFSIDKNFEDFYTSFNNKYDSINENGDIKYISLISKLKPQIIEFANSTRFADANYRSSANNMLRLIPKIENELAKPQNELHELLKRLILSIVIISFFLAILRYTSKLYTNNYNLMVQTENDELGVRKFYIGLKNTDKNNDERKIVIQKFIDLYKFEDNDDQLNLSKEETGIIKDLLSNLMKKI
ncbi:hypothetical protein K6T82_06930 [Flavobacterium sp. 17A]|uniref:Uncharacterized protein n=1 Tax=Flavobacterium potami TaxID=2872310 RepID=A0A9X1KP29_9FLAO|nr:hypothetical protein [Flavobacterium potami]MBZ4034493.1 hypothetical protein [Flavobacterium potami]